MTRTIVFVATLCVALESDVAAQSQPWCDGPGYGFLAAPANDPGTFQDPHGMSASNYGPCWVADTGHHRIVATLNGGPADSTWIILHSWGTQGTAEGQLNFPSDIEVGPENLLYVVDSGNNRIQVFTQDGGFVRQWGMEGSGNGQFRNPSYLALGDSIYVSETGNYRVQKFTFEGEFLHSWGQQGTAQGEFQEASGITSVITKSGYEVFVADRSLDRIQAFDSHGNYLREWGSTGSGDSQIRAPEGLDSFYGRLTIADSGNHRILSIDPGFSGAGCPWGPDPSLGLLTFSDMEAEYGLWTFGLDRSGGRAVIFSLPDPVRSTTWGQLKVRFK